MAFTHLVRSLGLAAAVFALAAPAPDAPPSAPSEEVHDAPAAARPGAPPEGALSPPPEAEKGAVSPGYVQVQNPAFPGAQKAAAPIADRGRLYTPADFSSYFAEGVLGEARAAFDDGRYRDVREKLKGQGDGPPVRYLRALSAVRAEDWEDAAGEMAALAEDYPQMRDRCLTHAGVAYEELKAFDKAAKLLAQVPADSKMYSDARLALFRSLRNAGRPDEAILAIEPLTRLSAPSWGRDVGAEALLAVADLAKSRNQKDAERDALQLLWAKHPLSPLAINAQPRLDLKRLPLERQVDRAETLVDAHRNKAGIDYLTPLLPKLKLPDPLACRAHFIVGKGLRKERVHARAIATLDPVVAQCTDPDLRPRAMYVLGSSRSIVQQGKAAETYELLAKDYPAHTFADDALYYAADVHLAQGEVDLALQRLAELAKLYPHGDFAADGLFKSFWIRRQRGEHEQAYLLLDQIETTFAKNAETYEVERARYWRARLHEKQGQLERAKDLYASLAIEHPATYYGLISRRRLAPMDEKRAAKVATALRFPTTGDVWPLYAHALGEDPHFQAGIELLRMGFREAVTSELLAANRTRAPQESIRLLVQLLAIAGDERAAHAVARTSLRGDLSGRITERTRPIWEVAYPRAFRDLLEKHCKTAGIEPDLLQALMREESALDPKALSWAGALGLTQLMPYTARAVGRSIGMKNITTALLLQPEPNIRIGSAYLGDLVKRFDGTYEYALAGYNAGGGAVSKWKRERPTLELDEWVEEIPIAETRGYVKRVLRSFNTYQLLYPAPEAVTAAPPQ